MCGKKRSGFHQIVFIHCIIYVWLSINSYPLQTLIQSTEICILITLNSVMFAQKHCTSFSSFFHSFLHIALLAMKKRNSEHLCTIAYSNFELSQ